MLAATLIGLALALVAAPQAQEGPANPIETFDRLDADSNQVVERGEVPEAGRDAFDRLLTHGDANRDGKLQAAEVRGLVARLRTAAEAGPLPQFQAMDTDGDGKVSQEEFRGPAPLFARLDADKDGQITRKEAAALRPGLTPAGLAARLKAMDADGDGKLTRQEFRGPARQFARLDADKDGVLTSDELRRVLGERRPQGKPEPPPEPS